MSRACDWVDAFADGPFGGNGCVVVQDAADLGVARRMALVRETSLSECAFMVGSDKADFGVRYYLADREIPMAGHPTIAVVAALIHRGMVAPDARFTLEVGAGVIDIDIEQRENAPPLIAMTQLAPTFGNEHDPGEIAALYGLDPGDIVRPPRTVSTGTPFCITLLRDKQALRRAAFDPAKLAAMRERDPGKIDFMEPFLVTLGGATPAGDTFARLLLAPPMPPEDPFTGSATGCLGAWLWAEGLIETPGFIAEQGHWMGRPGRAEVAAIGPRDAIAGVRVAGTGVVLMSGDLLI